ncbi:MAG: hypothetical protein JW809_17280 [Pirellulales bacterium]|nr:hypothetical protein [Pirellulales bacterium]
MKRLISVLCVAVAVGLMSATAQASVATVTFDAADIVADASLTVNTTGTPIVGDGYIRIDGSTAIRTYEPNAEGTSGNPIGFNAWLATLDEAGEGLSGFNLWLQDGRSNQATMWGEDVALASTDSITPFAPEGWTGSVIDCPWGGAFADGKLIIYRANSEADYLRPGNVPAGLFGFVADIMDFDGGTWPDYQIWVGAGNASQSDDTGFDQLAGVAGGIYFQRAITANAVPEPAALLVWSVFGALGLLGWARRR